MDPVAQLFGRSPFVGTGRVGDYFPQEEMDLSYLQQGKPDYLDPDAGYDPELDIPSLLEQGIPYGRAVQLQVLRAQLHAKSREQRVKEHSRGALQAINQIDPSRETFAKDLLDIFRRYPNADQSPEVGKKVQMLSSLARMMPIVEQEKIFDIDTIKDPDIYQQALKEGWDKLPEKAGKRREYDASSRKERRLQLIQAGLSPQEVDKMEKSTGLSEEQIVHAMIQAKQRAEKPEKTVTATSAADMAKLVRESAVKRQAGLSDPGKLKWIQDNLLPPDLPEKERRAQTDFPASAWEQAYRAAASPNEHDIELQAYRNLMGMTPSQVSRGTSIKGMKEQGNVDFFNRPVLDNGDGTTSTASTMIVGTDQGQVLIPSVIGGKRLSDDQAWEHYKKTGEHFGVFETVADADRYDKMLHQKLASQSTEGVQSSAAGGVVTISTEEEFLALPSGAKFIDSSGKTKTKK